MPSSALAKFHAAHIGAIVLKSHAGTPSAACSDQAFVDQTCFKATIALAVGCWEGYIEGALREFVSRTRVQAHRKAWGLIAQFETIVDKMAADLNTPNWDKARELLITATGMDPYSSWIWAPKFTNQTDTKLFFDGIMSVRHAFAHGFSIPANVPGLAVPGALDMSYVDAALNCLEFFATKTDDLLEYELTHRHGCHSGWN
ncbi:hypothetical protein ACI2S5_00710 [Ralstonia nicotianae]|uniref:hypothetical protein n=2 Tax=Ralstonia pseudosolanacearum TaxID=1310165 RepID=UPI000ADC48CC|nr:MULTISPECIES: hypothetical protein [Ralstonia]QKL51429.1 hypothetical protein HI816_05880 [Ralstonia solanacearum]MDO3517322.1 hypothetical protein [Ralstonia pseudosolanacearum]MDO3542732.1 hypothetical protein [Ralstonia pseudosolanacearum]QKL91621.1 hypothetical protein HI802_05615 [Ralstonia solanacearum]QKL96697.1 hypothetical protein HI801_05615 [Ralstonia solanacearum]